MTFTIFSFATAGFLTFAANTVFALLIFIKNPTSKVNRLFSLFFASVATYGLGFFLQATASTPQQEMIYIKILLFGTILIPVFFLHATYAILNKRIHGIVLFAMYALALVFEIVNIFTDLFARNPIPKFGLRYLFQAGPLYLAIAAGFAIGTAVSIWQLFNGYRAAAGIQRNKLKYLLLGMFVGFLGGSVGFALGYNVNLFPINPFSSYAVLLANIIIAYAIIRYRLLDIRLAVTRGTIFLVVYTLVLGMPFLIGGLVLGRGFWLVPVSLSALLASMGPLIYGFLRRKTEDRLLKEQRHYQMTLKKASEGMALIKDLDRLLKLTGIILVRTIGITWAGVYLRDFKKPRYILKSKRGEVAENTQAHIDIDDPLVKKLVQDKTSLVYDEIILQSHASDDLAEVTSQMRDMQASLIVPSFAGGQLLGFLALGDKLSKDIYSQDDINVFSVLANQAAIAIENIMFTEKLKHAQAKVFEAEKLASLGRLGAGMAHDINNPVNIMRIQAETMLMSGDTKDAKKSETGYKLIMEQCDRVAGMINDLLDRSKDSDEIEILDINDVVKRSLKYIELEQRLADVRVKVNLDKAKLKVRGNLGKLERGFANLIRNAVEAMNHKGRLDISTKQIDSSVEIQIKDTGKGIESDKLNRVFEPFYSTRPEGTGLGLYMCMETARNHGGSMDVESELGKGTTFTVKLPLSQ